MKFYWIFKKRWENRQQIHFRRKKKENLNKKKNYLCDILFECRYHWLVIQYFFLVCFQILLFLWPFSFKRRVHTKHKFAHPLLTFPFIPSECLKKEKRLVFVHRTWNEKVLKITILQSKRRIFFKNPPQLCTSRCMPIFSLHSLMFF